jgi:CheY-like chemotaxis protein
MMHILVVDDDPFAAEMIQATLEAFDYRVSLAQHALDAMEQWQAAQDIALIISDMNMPMVTGIELYQMLKTQGLSVPFILLTGDDPEPLRQQEPGLSACMIKDFSLDETLPAAIALAMQAQTGASQ